MSGQRDGCGWGGLSMRGRGEVRGMSDVDEIDRIYNEIEELVGLVDDERDEEE